MQDYVHLHVHSEYSILDGQASISRLVDKAIGNGMRGIALTDHGNMFGVKEFFNYVNKINGGTKKEIQAIEKELKSATDSENIKALKEKLVVAKQKLFKPIIGCEMYVARRGMDSKEGKIDQSGYHLVVLAKNLTGYRNLIKLVSNGWTRGFYMRPRTDREELEKYHEGLIVATACLGGEVPKKITQGDFAGAEEAIQWYKNLFGEDFYLEMQRHKATVPNANHEAYPLQCTVNEKLIEYAEKFNVKLICTNDVHFVDEENAEAHDRLICLNTGRDLDDPTRMYYTKQEWLKTKEEMNAIFSDMPEALSNTIEILDKIEFYSIDHGPIMPTFNIPTEFGTEEAYREKFTQEDLFNEFTQDEHGNVVLDQAAAEKKIEALGGYDKLYRIKLEADYLAKLAYEGAYKKYGEVLDDKTKERIDFELYIMKTMGFPGYFLIVQDFINAARTELDVSVGPGRGSAAGSAVAYCLGITTIDPIQYNLLFERFLNPDRISLPDIDVDFDDDGRGRVLEWVTDKYGKEKVAHIITYGTMATKLALKDVARVQKLPLPESDKLCKLIPDKLPEKNGKKQKVNLPNAIAYVPELQQAEASPNPILRDTIKYAKMLEGNVRNTGVHACGIIICRDDITDWVPVSTADDKETGEKMLVTQFEGSVIEDTGLIKMDFLGLKTLSIIKEAIENIRKSKGIYIDIDQIPLDDALTYQLYSNGKTIGTFQFESGGMQKYLKELEPSTFEDLIAMNALYRPGPMDYIPEFIDRKHGRTPISYDIPIMETYLKDTYGITVYQEQVMLLSRLLGGFTRGESDNLRKAMGKKLRDKIDQLKPKFINGGKANGHDPQVLEKIWGDWEKFAEYAFNKSHATCYSWVAYQTAYLKAHHPAEYMAATLSRNINKLDEVTKFMDECKSLGIAVLGPSINESAFKFSVNAKGDIRFGLGAIKGVGEAAIASILKEREENGDYKDIFDFVQRINLSACNKKTLENLVLSGAFDGFPNIKREDFFYSNSKGETFIETLVRYGIKYQTDKSVVSNSLFGGDEEIELSTPEIISAPAWGDLIRLNKERELVGLYLSAHPLDEYAIILNYVCSAHMGDLTDLTPYQNREFKLGGIVAEVRDKVSKNGKPFGIVKIEDFTGAYEFIFFGNDWIEKKNFFTQGMFLFLHVACHTAQFDDTKWVVSVKKVELLSEVKDSIIENITLTVPLWAIDKMFKASLLEYIAENPGKTQLKLQIQDLEHQTQVTVTAEQRINVTKELMYFVQQTDYLQLKVN